MKYLQHENKYEISQSILEIPCDFSPLYIVRRSVDLGEGEKDKSHI